MSKTLPADFHMHTHHSGDSDAPMEMMIEKALQKSLSSICITEHMDMEYPVTEDIPEGTYDLDTESYMSEIRVFQDKYAGLINIGFGVELGLQPQIVFQNEQFVKKYPFDFVIGSNHLCHGKDPYYSYYYENRSEKEAFTEFFESTLENIQLFDDFDVLGHLDYIVRYAPSLNRNYNYKTYSDLIDEILKTLIDKGKGLDVNSKSLYSEPSLGDTNPSRDVLLRFHELGGEILTFGSDAHKPEHVALGFDTAVELVKSCGFKYYTTFSQRDPKYIKL